MSVCMNHEKNTADYLIFISQDLLNHDYVSLISSLVQEW